MPNWVCNHLIIHGENAVEVMNSLLSENSESENGYDIDFNKIIPMPEDLKIESGSVTRDCAKLYVNAMLIPLSEVDRFLGKVARIFYGS